MNWDAIGAVGEILGAIAVVATLIYFGRQLSQANRISTVTGARELQQMYTHVYTMIATNSEMTRMHDPNYTVQSAEEQEQIDSFVPLLTGIWLTTAIAHEQGLIDSHQYQIYCEDVEVKLSKWPGLRSHAVNFSNSYSSSEQHEIFRPLYS